MISTLHRFIGGTAAFRPKGPTNASNGKRSQQPTRHVLPTRREALEHAWGGGLITDEEYDSALAVTTANEASAEIKFSTEGNWAVELPVGLAAANDQFVIPCSK